MNRCAGHQPTIILHKDGEPLLNHNLTTFIKMISYADPKLKIDIYTNGLLLTEEFIRFLGTMPNPIWLLVSFHFYNYDETGNDYESTNEVLLKALDYKPSNVDLIFVSHVTRFINERRLLAWQGFWKMEASSRNVKLEVHINPHINPWTGLIDEPNCVKFGGCPYADFGHIFFGATGNVVPCCMDLEEQITFGNIQKDDPAEVIEKLKFFYEGLNKKELLPPLCERCML